MKSKFLNNSKWIYFALGIISLVIVISSLLFMSQYKYVRINYDMDGGKRVYSEDSQLNQANQKEIFDIINQLADGSYRSYSETQSLIDNNEVFNKILEKDSNGDYVHLDKVETEGPYHKKIITYKLKYEILDDLYLFRSQLDSYNDMILIFGLVSAIMFALLLVISNHNRRIYYKANLIGGVLLPAVNVVFAIVLIINAISLMGKMSDPFNNALYNMVSVYGNKSNTVLSQEVGSDEVGVRNFTKAISQFNVNNTTLVIYTALFAVVAAYNVFLIVYAIMKYKATAKERNEVLENARLAGEKA